MSPAIRTKIVAAYDALPAPFFARDASLAELALHKTPLAVRRRLTAAADRRGWRLFFVSIEGESLVFQVRANG